MVRSQHLMLTDGLEVDHLRLILGTSMGCMQSFVWGETHPGFMDALMPLACLPTEIAGRNRMMRYMAIQQIKLDPQWQAGEYKSEPILGLRGANELLLIMGSSPLRMQKLAPTRVAAEKYADEVLAGMIAKTDANDMIYYLDASLNWESRSDSPNSCRIANSLFCRSRKRPGGTALTPGRRCGRTTGCRS